MKNSLNIFTILALMALLTISCGEDEPEIENPIEDEVLISSNINEDTTWETGKIYILGSRISVLSGVTLTIEPGDIASPNLDPTLNGLWGGLIVLGYAPISADAESLQIEGIPPSDQNGLYGGTDAADNSGVIQYISIRHGGANIGEGNEINGLTLGGVGSGTTIENVEIVSNQDDGIEWFGGSVNVSNVVVWNTGDDAIDTDQAWSGTLDNFAIINPGDECFELDGGEGAFSEMHTIMNGTVYWSGDLISTDIQNFDLRWEWFGSSGTMVSVSGFYKLFKTPLRLSSIPSRWVLFSPGMWVMAIPLVQNLS